MDDRRQSEPIVQQFHSDNEGQGGAGHVNGKYLHWGRMNHFKTDSKPSVPTHASSEMQQEKQCEGQAQYFKIRCDLNQQSASVLGMKLCSVFHVLEKFNILFYLKTNKLML